MRGKCCFNVLSSCKQKIPIIQLHVFPERNCSKARSPFSVITLAICEGPIPEISCSAPNLTNCYAIMYLLMIYKRDVIKSKWAGVLASGGKLQGAIQPWNVISRKQPALLNDWPHREKRWFTTDDESPRSILSFWCKFHAVVILFHCEFPQ